LKKKKKNLEDRVTEAKRKMESKRNIPTSRIKKSVESWESEIHELGKKYESICEKLDAARVQQQQIDKVYGEEIRDIELDNEQDHDSGHVGSDKEMLSGDSDIDNDDGVFFY